MVLRAYDDGIAFRYVLPGRGPVEISGETTDLPAGRAQGDVLGAGASQRLRIRDRRWARSPPIASPCRCWRSSKDTQALPAGRPGGQLRQLHHPQLQAAGERAGAELPAGPARAGEDRPALRLALAGGDGLARHPGAHRRVDAAGESESAHRARAAPAPAGSGPGRASWDFIAGDGDKLRTWIDFDAQMGWEYHVADAGWERRVPDMAEVTAYAKSKNVGVMVWGKVANRDVPQRPRAGRGVDGEARPSSGIRGAKIDFFDQRDATAEKTDDLEDTQARLQRARLAVGDRRPAPPDGRVPRLRGPLGRAAALAPRHERGGGLRPGAPEAEPDRTTSPSRTSATSWAR